jgi:hypothetical protein
MAKKTKTKAWVKGLIAVAVIAVIGGLGYYGANGEMFQGKLKLDRPSAKNVKTVDRVENVRLDKKTDRVIQPFTVDGVDEKLIMEVAQPVELDKVDSYDNVAYEKVSITDKVDGDVVYTTEKLADYTVTTDKLAVEQDNVALDAGTLDKVVVEQDNVALGVDYPAISDLNVGDEDIDLINIEIANTDSDILFITDLVIFEDGGGLYNYEVFVDGVKIDAAVRIKNVFIEKLGKEVREITFDFNSSFEIDAMDAGTFKIKADVAGGKASVAHSFDKVVMDGGIDLVNMDFDFASVARDIGKLK